MVNIEKKELIIASFENKVAAFAQKHGTVPPDSKVLVACSGGPDSMALLHWLMATKGEGTEAALAIGVACVDHSLRVESKAELAMVAHYAKAHDLPFYPSLLMQSRRPSNPVNLSKRPVAVCAMSFSEAFAKLKVTIILPRLIMKTTRRKLFWLISFAAAVRPGSPACK